MKNKVLFLWIGLILGFCLGWAFTTVVPKLSKEAGEKEAFAIMTNLQNAAEAARAEYGFYPQTFDDLGFKPAGELRWRLFYFSIGSDYTQCIISTETGKVFFTDSSAGVEEGRIQDCAQVIINSEKDLGNNIPDIPN